MIMQWIVDWLWQRVELKARRRITEEAFKQDRFVLRLHLRYRQSLEVFAPTEDEAPEFFQRYVLPVVFQASGVLSGSSWSGLPSVASAVSRSSLYRVCDVTRVEIFAPDDAYRDRLDQVLAALVKKAHSEQKRIRGSIIASSSALCQACQKLPVTCLPACGHQLCYACWPCPLCKPAPEEKIGGTSSEDDEP